MADVTTLRVIVAGAASGIGAVTAKTLAGRGARVVVADVNIAGASKVAEEIKDSGGTAIALQFDLSDEGAIKTMISTAAKELGGLDGLVNMAADMRQETVSRDVGVSDMDAAIWRQTLNVNLIGYGLATKYVLPYLVESGKGSIVNISSGASNAGEPTRPAYGASKAGVNALTRHTARTWGPRNIRANAVAVGLTGTEAVLASLPHDAQLQEYVKAFPLQRVARPEEIASVVIFLLSEESSYVTGQVWGVDGGAIFRD